MTQLPAGWVEAALGQIADTSLGKMLDRARSSGDHLRPYLRNVNVQWGRIDSSDVLTMDIPPEQEEHFRLRNGDLLICEGGEIGRCAVWSGGDAYMAFQKALHRVRPLGGIDSRYLRYLLEHLSLRGLLARWATGSTIKHLPQEQLRQLPVPLPPLAEQRRIVANLDEYLSRHIAAGVLIAESRKRISRLRRRVLQKVVEQESARAAVESASIASLATSVRNGVFVSRPSSEPCGVPILRIGSVRPLSLDISDVRYSGRGPDDLRARGSLLHEGDLLFTRYNGNPEYVGACAFVPQGVGDLTYPDKLIRVVLDRGKALPEYVAMACSVGGGREQIRGMVKTTAGQAGISGRDLKSVTLDLPPIEEQQRRVELFGRFDAEISRLDALLTEVEHRARLLRSSLLAEAFAGRLVPQDPDDEPASELLARIRAERAAAAPKQKARASRTRKELAAPPTRVTGNNYQQEALPL
ncbi:restriction endonuclease subunit S [Micromonospora marina]|uniref:Type I restriction enzyme, S subunit n=1 Tax=Micromonospora marina TaxID=307120 RepID=A0A1C4XR55_9ACTN|nr:restriction endonuclease subunit S [Micromonospora marina]SCF10832.1 type I restriction enzyme, S subunit [Micromonospora marina]